VDVPIVRRVIEKIVSIHVILMLFRVADEIVVQLGELQVPEADLGKNTMALG
jgi:hypothetical protein